MNSFGRNFRVSIFGESHGKVVGVTLDGVRAGVALCEDDFVGDMERRKAGALGTTTRIEDDRVEILSGVYNGHTTGAPLTLVIKNREARPSDYSELRLHPRPSHADFVAHKKFLGYNDPRGGGHFSGRVTAALTAAGVVAKKMLGDSVSITSQIVKCGDIEAAIKSGDSVGGVVECRAQGVGIGVGEPFFDSVESVLSHLLFSIPAVRGVEFGAGFSAAEMLGSQHNDPIVSADGKTSTNNAGGVVGGLTNGEEVVVRVAIKPTPSIACEQSTFRFEDDSFSSGELSSLTIEGRHDSCIALRAGVVVEAAVAIGLIILKV
ncbi:MAG: chorismate synthase [Rikenellaceae bacterium]